MKILFIIIGALLCTQSFSQNVPGELSSVKKYLNKSAPQISITTINNNTYLLGEPGNGITVVNFWFIACAPCRKEFPLLNELADSNKNRSNIRFISISNIDNKNALEYVKRKMDIKYELVAQAQAVADLYKIIYYPVNLIIDNKGIVVFAETEFHADIKEKMQRILDEL